MKELNELKEMLVQGATVIAELEQNKESIQMLATYTTVAVDGVSKFLQGNLESIVGMCTTTVVNGWGKNFIKRCDYMVEARTVLVDGGFTPEEAYDIIVSKKDELPEFLQAIAKGVKNYQDEQTAKKTKTVGEESR